MTPDGGAVASPERPHLAVEVWSLFVGLGLLLIGAGLFGTLLSVRAEQAGVSTLVSGAISAAYYLGFLAGSAIALDALGRVGHIRVFAALAALLSAAMLTAGLTSWPGGWIGVRFVTGLCLAGQYVVAESWLNDLADNASRGRLIAIYSATVSGSFAVGQLMLDALGSSVLTGFAVASIIASLGVVPVSLAESRTPTVGERASISLRELAGIVPTGVGAGLLTGMAHGALLGMGAVYATRVGLSAFQTGLFLSAPMVGGLIFEWPAAAASDDLDRRAVGIAACLGAVLAAILLLLGPPDEPMAFVLMLLLGGASYPLYSIAAAYMNDWVEPEHVYAAASQLVRLYGIGAFIGPFVATATMVAFGPKGYFWAAIGLHTLLAAFFVYRRRAWRTPLVDKPWRDVSLPARVFFVPATVVAMGRRLRTTSVPRSDDFGPQAGAGTQIDSPS